MKRSFLIIAAFTCAGCAPDSFEDVPLETCTEVEAAGNLTLRLVDAENAFLRIRGTPEAIAAVVVEAQEDKVRLRGQEVSVDLSCPQLRALQLLGTIVADAGQTKPALEHVAVYGSSALTGEGVSTPDLDVRVSGQGNLVFADLDVGNLQVLAGGSGQAVLAGSASVLKLNATGRSQIQAGELRAQSVTLEATSSSVAKTWATAHLDAVARDNADVVYKGTPDLNVQAEDSATVEALD